MNLQILSAMLEDHLTNEDIQEAQALLEWTYEETVDIRCQLSKAHAEIDALKAQRDIAIQHIAEWCVVIEQNGSSWGDWGQYYKDACRDNALPEIRELLDAAIKKARSDELGVQS